MEQPISSLVPSGFEGVPGGPLVAGFTAGLLHVVAGPDHITALAPLAVRNRFKAMRTGALWGAGHGTGVLVLGTIGIFFKNFIDVHFMSQWSECFVGFMLLGIGLWASRQTWLLHHQGFVKSLGALAAEAAEGDCESSVEKGTVQLRSGSGLHKEGGGGRPDSPTGERERAGALFEREKEKENREDEQTLSYTGLTAFSVGLLHGAAGTGHLFGVLPSLALPPLQAAAYLGSYLIAAILAMCGVGCLLGSIGDFGGPRAILYLMGGSAAAAVLVGFVWMGECIVS